MNKSLKEKLLQLFVLGYKGDEPTKNILKLVEDGLGGIIFFADNLISRKNFKQIINNFNSLSKKPLFLSIDQEGGLVERTIFLDKKIEYLTPKALNRIEDMTLFNQHYDILAKDLIDLGINLNFAPVLDVNTNPKNPIIGVRSFGDHQKIVNNYSKQVIKIFQDNNILTCGKHYPGHGDTNIDSHKNMPTIDIDFDEFFNNHLICFKKAIENNIDTIMVSHIYFPFFDKKVTPASLSKNAINYLKKELKFEGIIFSDDMVMGGISKYYSLSDSIILALKAGIDSLIFRDSFDELINAIDNVIEIAQNDKILTELINTAYEKIVSFKNAKLIKSKNNKAFDIENNQAIINNIANKTVTISGKNFILPKKANLSIISFDNKEIYNLSNNSKNLSDLLQTNFNVETIYYSFNSTDEDIKKINEQIPKDNIVIFLSYNAHIHSFQIDLFNSIRNKKIFVSCALEEDIKHISQEESIISLCSFKTPSLKALANIFIEK